MVGLPVVVTVNVVDDPGEADLLAGFAETDAAVLTDTTTASLATDPQELVATQSYEPVSKSAAGEMTSVAEVAPSIGRTPLNHWYVGAGLPDAAAVRVIVPPSQRSWPVGWVVNDGHTGAAPEIVKLELEMSKKT